MNYKIILILFSVFFISIFSKGSVKVYMHESPYYENIKVALSNLNIPYETVQFLDKNDEKNLFIIDNISDIETGSLPQYYIAYQTKDLSSILLSQDLMHKLSNAVAVWDISLTNIDLYKQQIAHYYYFPINYEFADPVTLPCLLPIDSLQTYKKLLIYSNTANDVTSSHVPLLFALTLLKNPKIILELGVAKGESSLAFSLVAQYSGAKLIGVDISRAWEPTYTNLHFSDAKFICMNDIKFPDYYKSLKEYGNQKIDIVFIDTSHLFTHTMQEINSYLPLLSNHGMLIFHDSNVTPLENGTAYVRINNTKGYAHGNTRGVTQAIKSYFNLNFDESTYYSNHFIKNGQQWSITHYPFCNGLTIITKLSSKQTPEL